MAKQASYTHKLFTAWVSATKQASHTLKLSIAWVSVAKQASYTLKLSIAWVSAAKQASHTHKLFTLRRKKGTKKLAPIICAHAEEEEGYREACSYHLCPRWGGRRVQRSLFLSPVPTLRREKGTEKLVPIICAHAEEEEGYREACTYHLCPRWGKRMGTGGTCPVYGSPTQWATLFIRLPAKGAANLISYRGVRRITAKIKTVICEQAPNHGSYFAYARLIARVNSQVTEQLKLSINIYRHFIPLWKCTKTMLQIWWQYTNFR